MDSFKFAKYRYKIAYKLVWVANRLVKPADRELSYNYWPRFRPIDADIKREGSFDGHKYACGAYSYEHLKGLVEQDGPKGFGARATVKWLIGKEGWKDLSDMSAKEITREFAKSGLDVEFPDEAYADPPVTPPHKEVNK